MSQAFVGLGSNLGDSRQQLLDAMETLGSLPGTCVRLRSRLYHTPPWGVLEQPPFVNAAVALDTSLAPLALLDELLAIERAAGRTRDGERWGPRTLDLDLLHMPGVALDNERLTLPHPRVGERAFVLLPLRDIAPQLELPGLGRIDALLDRLDIEGCTPLP
ncbi:2-amino-4-hydroxy-6-hydroxymethyldihydropteridine diphosphokinase [Dyella sp.]|uniref:2-amino-4-hydroxy-6- hydroxymethyldihydropteridine diphosphokinase n=1 Tax=Dyella sp. TaxID=1869338 RepID=UPI002ED49219